MKKLYRILNIMLWSFISVFVGSSIYKFYNYKSTPDIYAMQSAPWYLSIEIQAFLTAIIVVVIFVIMRIIKKIISEKGLWYIYCENHRDSDWQKI